MKRLSLVVGLVASVISTSPVTAVPIQWSSTVGGNDHWYEVVNSTEAISWTDSKLGAEGLGGHLATITSPEENDWITENMLPLVDNSFPGFEHVGPWLGGFQDTSSPLYSEPGGGWTWVTGESWSYTDWSPRAPNDGPEPIYNFLYMFIPDILGDSSGWDDNADFFSSPSIPGYQPVHSYIVETTTTVFEPTTLALMALGLAGLRYSRRKH